MTVRNTLAFIGSVMVLVFVPTAPVGIGQANAVTITLSAVYPTAGTIVPVILDPGNYSITVVGGAWNAWGSTNCPTESCWHHDHTGTGYITDYTFHSTSVTNAQMNGTSLGTGPEFNVQDFWIWRSPNMAVANAPTVTFSIPTAATIDFFINDWHTRTNTGGPLALSIDGVPEWNQPQGGFWHAANWDRPGFPNGNTTSVVLGDKIESPSSITADANVVAARITFDNPNTYNVGGLGTFMLEAIAGDATIRVMQGDHQFQAVVELNSSTLVDVADNASLTFNNSLSLNGNTLTKTGLGQLQINNALSFGGGTINLTQGTISGVGSIGGDVSNNGGIISPGNIFGTSAAVPEPASIFLILPAVIALGWYGGKSAS